MLPEDLDNFSQSVVATLLFANNFLLTLTSGYWDLNSDFKPLLHTWSLGVEEQFYLAYPLIVMAVFFVRRSAFPYVLIVGLIVSLVASVDLTNAYPNASFYLIHTRAWELLLGALAAYVGTGKLLAGRADNFLSLLGLVLIAGAIFLFNGTMSYPSYLALVPCIGTALILLCATQGTVANRLLSTPILVGIGLISYSAYLWHQPLFAFARILSLTPPAMPVMALLCVITLVLAYLSWKYVEQPFRDRSRVSPRVVFAFAGINSVLLMVPALGVYAMAGLPERVPGIGLGHSKHIAYNERIFDYKKDRFVTNKPHLLVVGSSTARDLTNVMLESGRFNSFEIIYRDDVTICNADPARQPHGSLIAAADALVWAASYLPDPACRYIDISAPPLSEKPFVLVGPKHFGYNLNAYIFTPTEARPAQRAVLMRDTLDANATYRKLVPAKNYEDLLEIMDRKFGGVPVFNAQGQILSADRVHLTQAGAALFSGFVFDDPAWNPVFQLQGKRPAPIPSPKS